MKYCTINKFFLKIAFLLFIALSISAVNAQTKGLIVERATGAGAVVLDPNGDGYSSRTTGGFFTDDQIESEIPYSSLVFPALEPTSDLSAGPNCSFTDFVDQGDQDPAQAYLDSNGNWMFRLRMGSTRPNAKSYSILIDTDGKFGGTGPNADPQYSSSNPGFEIEIVLATKFGVYVYDVNNMNCTPVISYTGTTNYQKSIALTEVCGDADYFYDFFVKMSDLTTYFATASPASTTINSSTAMRMAIVDNMAALKSTLCNPASASDIAGVDSNCGSLENCFTTIIDNYTPCAPGVVCPDRSLCPTINGPIAAGATSISITTTEAIGTIIKVYNGPTTLIGTSVATTTSPQTLNVTVTAVSSGNIIYATAQAPGEGASINNCNTVTVAAPCVTGALTGVTGNAKGICGGGLTSGATLRIYRNGILIHAITASNSVIEITGTTWRFKPNGNFSNCTSGAANMATGYYEVSQVISGCEGPKVAYDNGTGCSGAATTPVIAGPSPIYAGTATISGTSGASASIQLYIGGVLNSTFTANGSGVWTSASVTVTAAQSVYVVATETGKCTSATSASVTVLTKPIPTILGSYCGSVTSVTGTVAATAGTIQLYRSPSNVAVGSPVAISSNGTWTVTGLSLVSGNQIYATITFPQGTTSTSATTTIGNQTTNAVAITTPTILEGATTLSGTGISGDAITLYIDGTATIYTTTVNGSNNWTISPIPASEFYITALVSVTATTTGLCEGVPTASKTVQCLPPSVQTYTGGSKSYCFGNAGFISLGSSELGVIYQLVNSSGVSVGPSALGTGSAINLFTNALTANLTNVFVRAYKLVSPTCSVTSLVQINFDTQLPSPSVSLTSTNVSVLQGVTTAAFAFTNHLNTPTNYSIDFSIAAINAGFSNVGSTLLPASPINVVVPAAAPVGVYSAFLTITGGTACSSRYPITITVFAPSSAPIISSQPASADRCTGSGASFSITADSSLAITYRWEISTNGSTWLPIANGGVYSNATTSTLSISNVAGLDGYLYRGIATNTNGSATSVGATLNVNPLPTAFTVTGGGSYCSGGTGVAVGLANSTAGINYQLQLNGVDNGAAVAGTGSAISFGLKTAAGTYTAIATNATTACTLAMTGSAVITINPTPAVPTVVVTAPTCASAATNILSTYSASLTYTSTPSGLSVGAGGVITGGNNGTSYTITATNASLCSATTASFTFNGGAILETPAVPTVVVTSATCSSAATNIVSNYSASLNYTSTPTGLSVGAGGVITGGNNGTSYTITATNASLCSVNSASFTYDGGTILSTPAVPTVVVTSTTCSSAATNIVSNYSASLNYTSTPTGLSVGAGGVITGGNNGTSYTITATNASLCSVNSASFNYDGGMILSTPAVPTVVVTSATCSSAATNIVSNYSSSLNYTSTPTGLSVGAGGVITGGNNGTSYTITATNASLCSVTTASFTFNGGAILATPTVFSVTGGGLYCSGGTGVAVGLANTTTGIIYQLQLNGVNSGTAFAGTGSAISFGLKTLAGTYTVIATNNTTSCTSAMTGSAVITICSGGSIAATVWYDTNGDGIVDVGENGLQGATVTLDPGTPSNATDDAITATDASGKYIFNNLPAGNYTVSINVSTITAGIPAGYNSAQLVPTFDADGVGTHNKSTITLVSGENNLNQNFAYVKPSDNTTGGHTGGVESESLGDAISKIYVGRKKNSVPTEFVKSSKNLFNKSTFKTLEAYKGKEQTLLDMFPKELVPGNIANETSPKDILDYTIADQVLSVDYSIGAKTKAVVLGIKTSDKIYNHTKASCDRLRGAEILNIQKIKIQGYNFLMQGIKQRNGVVEYAISFAVAKNNNDTSYSIQTNWYVNAYTKFNDVYNFQVWSTRPADTQKLVSDILNNLKSYMPVNLIGQQKIPETYASKVYREKGELIVKLRSTKVDNTAEISMVELYSETANNIKFRDNTLSTNIKQELRVDIADGYEYDGLIKVNSQVEDAFYHADGNWGLDYDKKYTKINNYFVWNNFDRKYSDEEYSINRNVEIKATSEYDYLTVYKSLLPGTLSADYSEYKYLSFTAKGSGLTELGLIKSSIEDWKSQYRIMVDLTATEQTYYIPFDAFISANSKESMIPNDLTTLTFTFLPVEAKTKELDMFISNVKFVKVAGNDGIVINKKLKFDNSFLAYPNPSKGQVNLMLFSNNDTNAIITLTDLLGRTIYKSSTDLKVGRNELDFNFNIPSGTYILNVSSKDTDYGTSKIIFR